MNAPFPNIKRTAQVKKEDEFQTSGMAGLLFLFLGERHAHVLMR